MLNKPVFYVLVGLLTGSVATALVAATLPQGISPAVRSLTTNESTIAQMPANRPMQPLPLRRGMMGQRADQHFIEMMIPHHEDAIAMADLALTRSKRPEIQQLAQTIKKTQSQENQQMRTWYKQWFGSEVPTWSPGMGRGQGMGMGRGMGSGMGQGMGRGMGGCMRSDLAALEKAADFDRAFLEEMIPHHEMGVRMTHMIANSQRPELQTLADAIVTTQTAEIEQMQRLYQQWYQ